MKYVAFLVVMVPVIAFGARFPQPPIVFSASPSPHTIVRNLEWNTIVTVSDQDTTSDGKLVYTTNFIGVTHGAINSAQSHTWVLSSTGPTTTYTNHKHAKNTVGTFIDYYKCRDVIALKDFQDNNGVWIEIGQVVTLIDPPGGG